MKKKLPKLTSDRAAEKFVADSDLTEYDLSGLRPARFAFEPKSKRIDMRLPEPLLKAVKASAAEAGMPYQRFIRRVLEAAVQPRRARSRRGGILAALRRSPLVGADLDFQRECEPAKGRKRSRSSRRLG